MIKDVGGLRLEGRKNVGGLRFEVGGKNPNDQKYNRENPYLPQT